MQTKRMHIKDFLCPSRFIRKQLNTQQRRRRRRCCCCYSCYYCKCAVVIVFVGRAINLFSFQAQQVANRTEQTHTHSKSKTNMYWCVRVFIFNSSSNSIKSQINMYFHSKKAFNSREYFSTNFACLQNALVLCFSESIYAAHKHTHTNTSVHTYIPRTDVDLILIFRYHSDLMMIPPPYTHTIARGRPSPCCVSRVL